MPESILSSSLLFTGFPHLEAGEGVTVGCRLGRKVLCPPTESLLDDHQTMGKWGDKHLWFRRTVYSSHEMLKLN